MGAITPDTQSEPERARLRAVWEARPEVEELREQVEALAWRENLSWNPEGMTRALQFAAQWQADHGPLPETGIVIG